MLTNIETNLGFLIHDVSRMVRARFDEMARPIGVTRPQWRALLHISIKEGLTQADLAERLEVERITLCRMIDRLEESGMVERRSDPRDRRVWRLHLTGKSHEIVDQLSEVGRQLEDQLVRQMAPEEAQTLRAALDKIHLYLKNPDFELVAAE